MKDFIIMIDSASDMPLDFVKENNLEYVSQICIFDNTEYEDDFGQTMNPKDFVDKLRNGLLPSTSQPNANTFYSKFKAAVENDLGIICILLSSTLSGTINSANIARSMILDEFPEAKITIVDSLNASLGEGLLIFKAVEMKKNGSSLDEIAETLEELKTKVNTYFSVNDLYHLKRGGRISAAVAAIGSLLNLKPILKINEEGTVDAVTKAKGRKNSIEKLYEYLAVNIADKDDLIAIVHGDCHEDALKLKAMIEERLGSKNIVINFVGPVIGTHGGPEVIGVIFIGK